MIYPNKIQPRYTALFGLAVFSLIILILTMAALMPQMRALISQLPATLEEWGRWGPLLYIAIITLSVVVSQIPGAPLAVAAGAVWDPLMAGLYTVIGGFMGALIAYGLGKQLGPSILKALTGKTLRFTSDRSETYVGWAIFTTRLLPVFSFDLISYGAGIAGLSLPIYASATFFGMVPSTLLLTYLGNSIQLSHQALFGLAVVFLFVFFGLPLILHRHSGIANVIQMVHE